MIVRSASMPALAGPYAVQEADKLTTTMTKTSGGRRSVSSSGVRPPHVHELAGSVPARRHRDTIGRWCDHGSVSSTSITLVPLSGETMSSATLSIWRRQ